MQWPRLRNAFTLCTHARRGTKQICSKARNAAGTLGHANRNDAGNRRGHQPVSLPLHYPYIGSATHATSQRERRQAAQIAQARRTRDKRRVCKKNTRHSRHDRVILCGVCSNMCTRVHFTNRANHLTAADPIKATPPPPQHRNTHTDRCTERTQIHTHTHSSPIQCG